MKVNRLLFAFRVYLIAVLLMAFVYLRSPVSLAQTKSAEASGAETTIRLVDSSDQNVADVTALFYDGRLAKKLKIDNGAATVAATEGIIVARADGFQYAGAILDGSGQSQVELLRINEKHSAVAHEKYPLTEVFKQKTLDTMKTSLWQNLEQGDQNDIGFVRQTLKVLGSIEPEKTLAMLDRNAGLSLGADAEMQIKGKVAIALLDSDLESALELIEGMLNPMMRSMMYWSIMEDLSMSHPALPVLEKQLAQNARSNKQPMYRITSWAMLAEHYAATDRSELCQKVVDQQIEDVKKLPAEGWTALSRGIFAGLIVASDPELAIRLTEGIKTESEKATAAGRLAFYCCRTNPELAIKLLRDNPRNPKQIMHAYMSIEVAHRMALEHPDQATEVAESIEEPNQQAWALGMMAWRLHDSKPKLAGELLVKAIKILDRDREAANSSFQSRSATLAGLLPIAEIVAPEKVRPMIWQAVFHVMPRSRWIRQQSNQTLIQDTAGAIARYDRALAKALVGDRKFDSGDGMNNSASHQAAIEPEGLADYFLRIGESDNARKFRSYESLVDVLQSDESALWSAVSKPTWLPWPSRTFKSY